MNRNIHWITPSKLKKNAAFWPQCVATQSGPHLYIFHHILHTLIPCNCQLKMTPSTASSGAEVSKLWPATCFCKIKFYWDTVTLICLPIVYSCFHAVVAKISSCGTPNGQKSLKYLLSIWKKKKIFKPTLENERTSTGMMLGVQKEQLPATVTVTVIKFWTSG